VEGRFQELSELVAQVFEDLQPLARSHDVQLTTLPDLPDMPLDATRVQLILVNLVGNGIKFADADKSERFVHVGARREGEGTCTIRVEDNGIGISPERRSAIFESGVRLDTHLEDGEGLGLALAAEAARQLGGPIRVESAPGRGSTFSFEVREPPTDLPPLPSREGDPEA
jgi:signal transduction histidine kinase